mmetsp:Transcript_26101/g.44388  ORF Transcript_26101/g.44388 Transcript_26101/m.44388 type:complete len:219 (-) Transcript_26101:452-1108(-)
MSLLQTRRRLRLLRMKFRNRWRNFRLKRNLPLRRRKLMSLHLVRSHRLLLHLRRKGRRSVVGAGGEGSRGLDQTRPMLKRKREKNNPRLPVHGPILLLVALRRNLRVPLTVRRVPSRKDLQNLTRSPPPKQHLPKPLPKVNPPPKNLPPNLKLHKTNAHLRQLYSSEISPTQQKRRKFEPYLNLTAMPLVTKFLESHSTLIGVSVLLTLMDKLLLMRL